MWLAIVVVLVCAVAHAEFPDIRSVAPDLSTPTVVEGAPAAGKRVRQTLPQYAGTQVHHALYLPLDWKPGRRYPVIVEYAGNAYNGPFGDISEGTVEGSNLGYGISGGKGFIWLCLPYVSATGKVNEKLWWGDLSRTTDYAKKAVRMICEKYGGDPGAVILSGFSRGAIACNYVGLYDDEIAGLWRGFIAYSHYDGVRAWPQAGRDQASALERLRRLRGRPVFVIQEVSVEATRAYITSHGVEKSFTFRTLEFRNHNDAWALRDIPERREARTWLEKVLAR